MKNFITDERAVSPILGFMLVAAICISMLTYTQVYSVPVWNTEIEFDHIDAVYDDMMHVASDIEDVAISGVPKSSVIQLGVEYPSRALFRNPRPGMVGTLSVEPDQTITINYTKSGVEYNETYSSCSIRYTASGTAMNPTIVYEHGIVIRDYGEYGNSTTCEQSLLSGDNVNLVITNGSYSSSLMETGRLAIYYNNTGSETVSGNITRVNITMTTSYPDIWKNLLEGKNTTNTTVSFSENKIMINSTAIEELSLPEMKSSFSGIYAGVARFSTEISQINVTQIIQGGTNINTSEPNYPIITDIIFEKIDQTHCNISATVKNATAPFDIHADLSDLTKDSLKYDVSPDYSTPDDITADSWNLPNENSVTWGNIYHQAYDPQDVVVVTFWVVNTENDMQFSTMRVVTGKTI